MITEPRDIMIRLLKKYLSKSRIQMKTPMRYYLTLLESDQSLKVKHLRQLTPYLKLDLNMTDKQVFDFFYELTVSVSDNRKPAPLNTLEHFFEEQPTPCQIRSNL